MQAHIACQPGNIAIFISKLSIYPTEPAKREWIRQLRACHIVSSLKLLIMLTGR
jgi:hypothetical protein